MSAPEKLCFVIGPMGGGALARLHTLAYEVVAPLLAPHGYTVETPDHAEIGKIMDQVLLSLDQADLLVADLTGHNPNVLYELGIYHTAGRPYVTVRDPAASAAHDRAAAPFDVAAYRFTDLDLSDPAAAREALAPVLEQLFATSARRDWYSNPVTDFYQAPVTHLRYASALAENYLRNFVRKVVDALYEHDGTVVEVEGVPLPDGAPRRLDIVVPDDFNDARHRYIERKLVGPGRLVGATVRGRNRPFALYAYPDRPGHLVDIPTILATIRDSVEQRLGPAARMGAVDPAARARLEVAEARRFRRELRFEFEALMEERLYEDDQVRLVFGNPFR
jgi:hypothetical protein